MASRGAKYVVNDQWYMKRAFKNLQENEKITIVNVYKRGRKTFVDGTDINQVVVNNISVKMLRKRPC